MKATLRILTGIIGSFFLATGLLSVPGQVSPAPTMVSAASTRWDHPRDFDGDGNADVLARDSHGTLWLYPGNGYGGFLDRRKIGTGWNGMTAIITGYFTTSGHNDIVARDRNGNLWLYAGAGHATFKHPVKVGNGWNAFTAIVNYSLSPVASAVMVRDRSGGLWIYGFNTSTHRFLRHPQRLGGGWNEYVQILSVGDWNGDSDYGDLIAIDRSGRYWIYAVDPYSVFYPRRELAGPIPRYTAVISPADWDGKDGFPNLIGRDSHGDLWEFGTTVAPIRVGNGFNSYTLY